MSHTFSANYIHIVFSTDGRLPSIPRERLARMYDFIGGLCRRLQVQLVAAGGITNHVHLLMAMPTTMSVAEIVSKIKANSSRWISRRFAWQQGYGVFSVSPSMIPVVEKYIRGQEEHHTKRTYDEEMVLLLRKCGIQITP